MGRSRGNFHADDDPTQRSRRKKNAPSGENLDSVTPGQGSSEGKRALYHCNYCNKDITGKIRIKCAVCSDFDLCIECFSVGAELQPHKSNHPYRVMDILSFPLLCPDWNADEEMLLLEGMEMYGMGNWAEVGEHVGTKSKEACIEHYKTAYLNSPYFPLPDMSHVVGKNRKELLAMAKGYGEEKKELTPKDEMTFSPSGMKAEDLHKGGPSNRLLSTTIAGTTGSKKVSNTGKDQSEPLKLEVAVDQAPGKSFSGNKRNPSKDEGPSLVEISGYNPKRHEFDPEYDNDAEQLLADMEFKETDTKEEHEIKLRVLRIYGQRLDERKRRKDFIIERGLLYPSAFERDLNPEEKELCRRFDVFMRFHTKEEHLELLKSVVGEHRILKRIQLLKEARAAGCSTSAEADRYHELKRKREAEGTGPGTGPVTGPGTGPVTGPGAGSSSQANPTPDPLGMHSNTRSDVDILAFPGVELLSESEKKLCVEIKLAPPQYLKMQELMTKQIFSGNITKKSDAHALFQLDPAKVDKVYDMLVKKGIAPM